MDKLKNKILFALLFLLLVILFLGLTGFLSIYYLSQDSKAIIAENYTSVEYTSRMIRSVNQMYLLMTENNFSETEQIKSRAAFEFYLHLQGETITEKGEDSLFRELQTAFNNFRACADSFRQKPDTSLRENLRIQYQNTVSAATAIYDLNMDAINRKSLTASQTADRVMLYMSISAGISILITLLFIMYFPSYLISPLKKLTAGIKEISNRKFDKLAVITSGEELKELADAFNTMAEGLKKHETERVNELMLEKQKMEALVLNLQDAIVLLDASGEIILVNDRFCELTELRADELSGKQLSELRGSNYIAQQFRLLDFTAPVSANKPFEMTINGKKEFFRIIPLKIGKAGNGNSPTGYIIIIRNVTEYQERDQAKTDLIATVSHELKTPLSSINLALKLLDDDRIGSLNAEQKKLVDSVRQQVDRIIKLVNEILNYAQAETGHITLSINQNDVQDIIELATFAVLMLLNEKNIDLRINISKNIPPVRCDLEKTVWVVVNLLTNAVRYSKSGSKINIDANGDNGSVIIAVKDEGPGISEEEQIRIFEKYVKSKTDPARGSGLGLAIAREFVEVQGGRIGVESKEGEGSRFYFTLPV